MPDAADLARRVADLEQRVRSIQGRNGVTVCVFSGELDRLLAAFSIANGAAACGMRVSLFFTFWATSALRRESPPPGRAKGLVERMFGWLLPAGPRRPPLSRLHMGGIGRALMAREMRLKGMPGLPDQLDMAREAGVEILACGTSMELMGLRTEDLIDYPGLRVCGATQFVDMAAEGNVTLFI